MRYSFDLRFVIGTTPSLRSTRLYQGQLSRLAVRGKTGGAHRTPYTFQWTGGVQAFALLFVATAAAGTTVVITGGAETSLRSLEFALSKPKRHQWILDVLGTTQGGNPLALRLIRRSNPEGRRGGTVHASLDPSLISPSDIRVYVNEVLLTGADLKDFLAQLLKAYGEGLSLSELEDAERVVVPSRHHTERSIREIAFISPVVEGKPFYSEVLERVVLGAARIRHPHYKVIPFLPTKSFDSLELWSLLQQAGAHVDGVVFIPDDPDTHREDILHFVERWKVPLVLFDVNLSQRREDDLLPPFVGGDEEGGGRLAAQLLAQHLCSMGVHAPEVLILKATSVDWENRRALSFQEELLKLLPMTKTITIEGLKYERARAKERCLNLFYNNSSAQTPIDAIFACDDEMALGARGAILHAQRLGKKFQSHLKIIGYDGIREMKDYIDNRDPFILATVDVQIEKQVTSCLQVLYRLMEGRADQVAKATLITPLTYTVSNADAGDYAPQKSPYHHFRCLL